MNIHSVISLIGGLSAVSHSCSTDAGEAERAFNKQKEGVTSWYRHQGGKTVLVRVANHDASNAQADAAAKKVKAAEDAAEAAKAAEAVASEKSAELVSAEAEAEAAAAKVVAVAEYEAAMARAEAAGVLPVGIPDPDPDSDSDVETETETETETEKSAEQGDLPKVKSEVKTQEKTQERPKGLGAAVKPGGKK